MEQEVKVVTVKDEEGNNYEFEVLKEFDYKGLKYAVLHENQECSCEKGEGEECEGEECEGEECDCDQSLYIFEIKKTETGEETFEEVKDENLMDELISNVEKLFFGEEAK